MKTIKILSICFLLSFTLDKSFAQNSAKILLTITIYESGDKAYNKILVFQNDKKLEEIELPILYYKDLDSHQIAINKILLKYMNDGYKKESELRGSVNPAGAPTVMVTTYIFEK